MIWNLDTCACAFEVDNQTFKFMRAVNVCEAHVRDTPEDSFKAAHEYNVQVNLAKAAEAEAEAQDG